MTLSIIDQNRVTAFKNSLLGFNKSLYHAREKDIVEYFDFQEKLLMGITDEDVKNELLAQLKPLKEQAFTNHKKYT